MATIAGQCASMAMSFWEAKIGPCVVGFQVFIHEAAMVVGHQQVPDGALWTARAEQE